MGQSIKEWTKQNLWKTAFKIFEGVWSAWGRPYTFKFFKGCLPQILLRKGEKMENGNPTFGFHFNSYEEATKVVDNLKSRKVSKYWYCFILLVT